MSESSQIDILSSDDHHEPEKKPVAHQSIKQLNESLVPMALSP
jgi:hypothetical protein